MEFDFLLYVLSGAAVGIAIGITGVGGGSLMTPLLLLFGFPLHIAVGTDLMYAAITKSGGMLAHHKQKTVRWDIMKRLALGSLPAAAVTVIALAWLFTEPTQYSTLLTHSLGLMLIITSCVLIFRKRIEKYTQGDTSKDWLHRHASKSTIITGLFLGVFVTLSSVGAGAFGAAALLMLYPTLKAVDVVGTDLAHAVPLTLVAGLGHVYLGNVDFSLLAALLLGSLPAIQIGTRIGKVLPDRVLQPVLATMLLALGVKFAFF